MTTATAERIDLRALSDADLAGLYPDAAEDVQAAILAECARRDRSDKARAAARERNAEWEATAYANYLAADARCRGFLLSAAGKATGRDPWPLLWQGSRETADRLASDDLITFWDYECPRPPGPAEYAAAKREAAAEQAARHYDEHPEDAPKPKPKRQSRPRVKWVGCTGGAVRETPVRIGDLTVTAWAAMSHLDGTTTIHPSRPAAERFLAPPPPAEPEPELAVPDFSTGTTDDHVIALSRFAGDLADRAKRRAERVAEIQARVAARNTSRISK